MSLNDRVVVADSVHVATIASEAVLLHSGTGHYYALNETGAFIWSQLAAGETLEQAHSSLEARFQDLAPSAWEDLLGFVRELQIRGLVDTIAG